MFAILTLLSLVMSMQSVSQKFQNFMQKYNKQYNSNEELLYRESVFKNNLKYIDEDDSVDLLGTQFFSHGNKKKDKKKLSKSYRTEINQFIDMTDEEFKKYYLLPEETLYGMPAAKPKNQNNSKISGRLLQTIPRIVDWQSRGIITPVKDQKRCNSCYAFSAIAGVEAWNKKVKGSTAILSEQEILDCSTENLDCVGGIPANVMSYILYNDIDYTSKYPYLGIKNTCARGYTSRFTNLYDFVNIAPNIIALIQSIALGPTVVAHYASSQFKFYKSGVFDGEGCAGITKANHSSLAIGYDLSAPIPYIKFKNSWTATWGDLGFYKIAIGKLTTTNKGLCLLAQTNFNIQPVIY